MSRAVFASLLVLASHIATLPQKGFPYKLPDGYSIERTSGVYELHPFYAYGAILVSMIELAYEDAGNQTDPVSKSYAGMTVNITGGDDTSRFYRQFATYTLYHALQVLTAEQNVTVSNFPPRSCKRRVATTHWRVSWRSKPTSCRAFSTSGPRNKTNVDFHQRIERSGGADSILRIRLVRPRVYARGLLHGARDYDRHGLGLQR
ncbi:MAG: hypothetical protein Q9215_003494 [Flavoplaca cf. flavocitrina]